MAACCFNPMKAFLLQLNEAQVFYATLLLAVILIRIPLIGVYFRTVNTLFHENGHALAAILLNGEVTRIELKNDTSGTALTKTPSSIRAMLVAFSGYPFATLCAALFFWLSVNGYEKAGLLILISLALINLILFVRNTYGIIWLLTFSGIILLVNWLNLPLLTKLFFLVISQIVFAEAIISTLVVFYLGLTRPRKAGDVTILARLSHIPAAFWAILITGIGAGIAWFVMLRFFPPPAQLFF